MFNQSYELLFLLRNVDLLHNDDVMEKSLRHNRCEPETEFAISGYLKIVSECPSPFSWSDLAIAYFATDNFDKAVTCGKKSVELLQNETHSKAIQ